MTVISADPDHANGTSSSGIGGGGGVDGDVLDVADTVVALEVAVLISGFVIVGRAESVVSAGGDSSASEAGDVIRSSAYTVMAAAPRAMTNSAIIHRVDSLLAPATLLVSLLSLSICT